MNDCLLGIRLSKCFPQSAITGSKITIETLEQGVKYVQSNNKDT